MVESDVGGMNSKKRKAKKKKLIDGESEDHQWDMVSVGGGTNSDLSERKRKNKKKNNCKCH
jgi:hypothetical protein